MMTHAYLEEMAASGYNPENIDIFHRMCLPYLGEKYFPSRDAVILDVGAGQGHCLLPLQENGWKNLSAVDRDDFNKDLFVNKGIDFLHIDVETEHFSLADSSVDVVLFFHVIEHLKDPSLFLSESHRILKKGGSLIVVTPDWREQYKTFWRDHTHIHPFDKQSLPRLLRAFDFVPIDVKSFGVFRGIGRTGLWKHWKTLMFTGRDMIAISRAE